MKLHIAVIALTYFAFQQSMALAQHHHGHSSHHHHGGSSLYHHGGGHYDTTTHYDVMRHNGHYDYVPHTTTRYHDSHGHLHGSGTVILSTPSIITPTVISPRVVTPTVISRPVEELSVTSSTVVKKPLTNAIPYMGRGVTIRLPKDLDAEVSYIIDGNEESTISSGEEHLLKQKGSYVVTFSRGESEDGEDFGDAKYRITEGVYHFTVTDRGWELFRQKESEGSVTSKGTNKNKLPRSLPAPEADDEGIILVPVD